MVYSPGRKIFSLILPALLCLAAVLGGCGGAGSSPNRNPASAASKSEYIPLGQQDGMDIAARNSRFTLLYDPLTTAVAVKDNTTGALMRSSPLYEEYRAVGGVADVENEIKSSLVLRYYKGNDMTSLFSYSDSVEKGQFKMFAIPDGVRVEYTIGEASSVEIFPVALTARFVEDELIPKLSDEGRELFSRYYSKRVYGETDSDTRAELLKIYPGFERHDFYQQYVASQIPIKYRDALMKAFAAAGLGKETMEGQYALLGYSHKLKIAPSFFVPVEYRLTEDALEASVCAGEITYYEQEYQLTSLDFLPFFGACAKRGDGYMLLPDGAGILVGLDNASPTPISLPVYSGELNTDSRDGEAALKTERCFLPVYGMKQGGAAFFTVLGEGSAMAAVQMSTSNSAPTLNRVYTAYTLKERQSFSPEGVREDWTFTRFAPYAYTGRLTQNIYLLDGGQAGLGGMAEVYRGLLFPKRRPRAAGPRLMVESYGVVSRRTRVLGFPRREDNAYTTISQLTDMLAGLREGGAGDITAIYRNWGGDPSLSAPRAQGGPHPAAGSGEDMKKLQRTPGAEIILDFNVLYAAKDSFFSPAPLKSSAAYSIQNNYLRTTPRRYGTGSKARLVALNPGGTAALFRLAGEAAAQNEYTSLYIEDIGSDLYTDMNKKSFVGREDFKSLIAREFERLSEEARLAIDGANAYLLPFADTALNLPFEGSKFAACDEEVPFLQMVLRGFVRYAGEPVNLSHNRRKQFLKSLEYGAEPCFALNWNDASVLKNTNYAGLYSAGYSYNAKEALEMYAEYEKVFAKVGGGAITGHAKLAGQVFETWFEGGGRLIVNYGSSPYKACGQTAGPMGYIVLAEGE